MKAFPTAPAGILFPSQPGPNQPSDYPGFGNSYEGDWRHFEPRIGLSYDPRGLGKEVIRASYGTFYDFETSQTDLPFISSPPWGNTISRINVPFSNPYAGYTYGSLTGVDPFPIPASKTLVFPTGAAYATFSELNVKARCCSSGT